MLPRDGLNRAFCVLLKLVDMAMELMLALRVPLELRETVMSK